VCAEKRTCRFKSLRGLFPKCLSKSKDLLILLQPFFIHRRQKSRALRDTSADQGGCMTSLLCAQGRAAELLGYI
jgi:hypothetical protein